jgi:hypothetical protein
MSVICGVFCRAIFNITMRREHIFTFARIVRGHPRATALCRQDCRLFPSRQVTPPLRTSGRLTFRCRRFWHSVFRIVPFFHRRLAIIVRDANPRYLDHHLPIVCAPTDIWACIAISVAPLCTRRSGVGCLDRLQVAFRRVLASSSQSGAQASAKRSIIDIVWRRTCRIAINSETRALCAMQLLTGSSAILVHRTALCLFRGHYLRASGSHSSLGPFGHSQAKALLVAEDLCLRQHYCRCSRAPATASAQCGPTVLDLRTPITELVPLHSGFDSLAWASGWKRALGRREPFWRGPSQL